MRVGVPKEIKNHEYRVGLTPPSVAELVAAGHEVIVETKAGSGIDFEDQDYVDAGARIVATAAKELAARGGGRCLVSICTAGGMGVVAILER